MSLLPLVFRDMMRPLRMLEHQMRIAEEFFPMAFTIHAGRKPVSDTAESVLQDRDKFQVKLDVQNFAPQELTVKTHDDNAIVVEGKHERKDNDQGEYVSQHFVRKFVLPKGHDLKDVVSTLSSNGILTIIAPRKRDPAIQERTIPIMHQTTNEDNKKE